MMQDRKFTQRHRLYRGAISAGAVLLLLVTCLNFLRHATTATDENLFKDPPSPFMATSSQANLSHFPNAVQSSKKAVTDSVRAGDLVISLDGQRLREASQFKEIFRGLQRRNNVKIRVFRPTESVSYSCTIDMAAIADSFVVELPPTVHVYEVIPGGASDLAGMLVGDLIYKINGQSFTNLFEADVALRSVRSGKTILYEIIRNGQKLTLPVTLAKFGMRLPTLVLFLAGLIYWGCGLFLGISRPNMQATRLLAMCFMGYGFVMMVGTLQRDVVFDVFAQIRTFFVILALPLCIALWNHSKAYFPYRRDEILQRRWYIIVPYALAICTVAWPLMQLSGFKNNVSGPPGVLIAGIVLMAVFDNISSFIFRKQRSKEYVKVRRIITFAGILTFVFCFAMIVYFESANEQTSMGLVGLALLPFPIMILYVIGRYQLFDLNIRIRRNIQYSIITWSWVVLLVATLLRVLLLLPSLEFDFPNVQVKGNRFFILARPPDPQTEAFLERIAMIGLALLTVLLIWMVGKLGQKLIERLFSRQKYDLSQATGELAEVMATKLGMDELARGIVERLASLMLLKRVGILFLRDEAIFGCQDVHGYDGKQWERLCLRVGPKLISDLQKFRHESRLSVDSLSADVKQSFHESGFRYIMPIRFKEKLVGIFVIGEKISEAPLHLEDLNFLSAVAKQASIAIENASLHEKLREQDRLKHELTIARRIQMASLPQEIPIVDGLDISGASEPALEVGGDYFDYLNGSATPGVTVIVGDVSGKGTSAALYMSKMQGIIRSLHAFNLSPGELFVRVNKLLSQDLEKKAFVTALGAFIDTDKQHLVLARAGHLPLFHYRATSNTVDLVTPRGLGMGLDRDELFASELEEMSVDYQSGDVFLFVTDGITEARNANGQEFGEDKLVEHLLAAASSDAESIRRKLFQKVKLLTDHGLPLDDQTVVVVKIR